MDIQNFGEIPRNKLINEMQSNCKDVFGLVS